MPLWTHTKKPNWTPNVPDEFVKSTNVGWIDSRTGEILVAIPRFDEKHDVVICNLELEDGSDFILEDDSMGQHFLSLESC